VTGSRHSPYGLKTLTLNRQDTHQGTDQGTHQGTHFFRLSAFVFCLGECLCTLFTGYRGWTTLVLPVEHYIYLIGGNRAGLGACLAHGLPRGPEC
jgi:hypothetical protein